MDFYRRLDHPVMMAMFNAARVNYEALGGSEPLGIDLRRANWKFMNWWNY